MPGFHTMCQLGDRAEEDDAAHAEAGARRERVGDGQLPVAEQRQRNHRRGRAPLDMDQQDQPQRSGAEQGGPEPLAEEGIGDACDAQHQAAQDQEHQHDAQVVERRLHGRRGPARQAACTQADDHGGDRQVEQEDPMPAQRQHQQRCQGWAEHEGHAVGGADQTQRTAALPGGHCVADHGAGSGNDAARADALHCAADQHRPETRRQRDEQRTQREQRHAGQVDRPPAVAVTQVGQQRGAAQRTQHEHDHQQAGLAMIDAESLAQRRDRRRDDGGVQRSHEDPDEQRRHQPAWRRGIAGSGVFGHGTL